MMVINDDILQRLNRDALGRHAKIMKDTITELLLEEGVDISKLEFSYEDYSTIPDGNWMTVRWEGKPILQWRPPRVEFTGNNYKYIWETRIIKIPPT